MPRIYTSANDPLNFCQGCFPSEQKADEEYGHVGDGPDGRGNCFDYDADHPDYGCEDYRCHKCGRKLKSKDNYSS